MIEGNFNPTGGCYPDADMIAYLSGSPPPLPVEMTDFTARPLADGQVQLRWETAQEINVNRFEVLRSKDGIHWDLAGSVEACGSCSFTNYYEFFDKPASSGTWYYRILTVDNDGSIEHSPTATVELKAEKKPPHRTESRSKRHFGFYHLWSGITATGNARRAAPRPPGSTHLERPGRQCR